MDKTPNSVGRNEGIDERVVRTYALATTQVHGLEMRNLSLLISPLAASPLSKGCHGCDWDYCASTTSLSQIQKVRGATRAKVSGLTLGIRDDFAVATCNAAGFNRPYSNYTFLGARPAPIPTPAPTPAPNLIPTSSPTPGPTPAMLNYSIVQALNFAADDVGPSGEYREWCKR